MLCHNHCHVLLLLRRPLLLLSFVLSFFLLSSTYPVANTKQNTDVEFLPISGFVGINLKDRIDPAICSWHTGPSLLEYLDSIETIKRPIDQPMRMPVSEKFRDMGTMISGKLESGYIKLNQQLLVMPNNVRAVPRFIR